MLGVYGRIQREGEVVHLVAHRLTDLPRELRGVGYRDHTFPLPHGRGDEFHHGSPTPDPRGLPKGPQPRDMSIPICISMQSEGEDAGFQIIEGRGLP
ncbi:DNA polymerase III, alpha chain [Rhizobium freirei PRF 81]|uniref:DNA polymerase III, alpha chain n=1 Tax=Rhizobium freirei PRF 81 TaxID=363754 RepID=N6UED0_9HYPH|nr:DNA polymerase III, alpha chain [Rhizobium freirei PRF 81]